MTATQLRWGSVTMAGRVRPYNQDAVMTLGHAFAVADGMGGHAAGDIASRTALDAFTKALPEGAGIDTLVTGFRTANRSVIDRAATDPDLRGMGTTLCALALVRTGDVERLAIANVGDSRAYVLQDGRLAQVSRDHSYVEDLVSLGQLTHEEARTHPQKNIVTRALGIDTDVQVDVWEVLPFTGDRYLLCSDGLSNEVPDELIREVLSEEQDPQVAAERLAHMADDAGGRDNISVVVVDVVEAPPGQPVAAAAVTGSTRRTAGPSGAAGAPSGGIAPDTSVEVTSLGDWLPDAPEVDETTPVEPIVVGGAPQYPLVAPERRPHRSPVRTTLFVLALMSILVAALGSTAYYARNVYTVRLRGDALFLEQGRQLLWFDITVEKSYGEPLRAGLPPAKVADVEAGQEFSSVAAADRYVRNLQDEAATIPTTVALPATIPTTVALPATVAVTTTLAVTTTTGPTTTGPTATSRP